MNMYNKDASGITASEDFQFKRLRAHFEPLFPLKLGSRKGLSDFISLFKEEQKKGSIIVYSKEDIANAVFLALVLYRGKFFSHMKMNGYELIDIYLGHQEDVPSLLSLEADVIMITLGYNEFENRRQEDAILQVLDNQVHKGHQMWIFYKGSQADFKSKFSKLRDEVFFSGGSEIDIGTNVCDITEIEDL